MKKMIDLKKWLMIAAVLGTVIFTGCKDDEAPDPRMAFVGSYEMDDLDVNLSTTDGTDSTYSISNNSEIEFEIEAGLDADELKMDVEELLEDLISSSLQAFIPVIVNLDLDDDAIVEISNNEFELDGYEFNVILSSGGGGTPTTYPCELNIEGEIDGEEITLDFKIEIFAMGDAIIITGTIEGEKE